MIATAQVSVSDSATALRVFQTDADPRHTLVLTNRGTVDVYLGDSEVTASTGWLLSPGTSLTLDLPTTSPMYGITASGTATVHVLGVEV